MDEPSAIPSNVAFDFSDVNMEIGGDGSDYGDDSEDLESLDSDDDFPHCNRNGDNIFNPLADLENPSFRIGLIFASKQLLKEACESYSVGNNREIKTMKNDNIRFTVKCTSKGCPFFIHAGVMEDKRSFKIKSMSDEHICALKFNNKRCTSTYMSKRYLSAFRSDPDVKLKSFRTTVREQCNIEISKWAFYWTKKNSLSHIRGAIAQQYKLIFDYCAQLRNTNTGSNCFVEGDEDGKFKRAYICLAACRDGLLSRCRKLIGLDGCFLKSEFGGELLAAVGIDGNNGMFPIGYAVVNVENLDKVWFLTQLHGDLRIGYENEWTLMSDKQKGLVPAVANVFPNSKHRCCVRHLYNNFKKDHKWLVLKHALWRAARATNVASWQRMMEALKELDKEAYTWLEGKMATQWARSHFRVDVKCDMLLNNLCEAFNASIVEAREKSILTMLEQIRYNLMTRMVTKKQEGEKWKREIGPRIWNLIEKRRPSPRYLHATYSGDECFEVTNIHSGSTHVVNLAGEQCSCGAWQLSGLPCAHVLASLESRNMADEVMRFVHISYKKTTYLRSYSPRIRPMTSPEIWPNRGLVPLAPPPVKKMPGRPKKARRRELGELPATTTSISSGKR